MHKNLAPIKDKMRERMDAAGELLWKRLSTGNINNWGFERRQAIGPHRVDFVCISKKIILELYDSRHPEESSANRERDNQLNAQGYIVLKFCDEEIFHSIEAVMEVIHYYCLCNPPAVPQNKGESIPFR
jgi:leucyl-tRNA synthetase